MAFLELAVVVLAFGTMAVVFALEERAEWRRLVARADAVLARQRSSGALTFDEPGPDDLREAA